MPRAVSWGHIFRFSRLGWEWPCVCRRTAQGSRRPSTDPGRPHTEWGLTGHAEQGVAGLRPRPSPGHRDPRAWISRPHVLADWWPRSAPGPGGEGAAPRRQLSYHQPLRSSEAGLRLRGERL